MSDDEQLGVNTRRRRLLVPFGTRPEIIKLAPVVRALRNVGHGVVCVNTGQHSTPIMSTEIAHALDLVADVTLTLIDEGDQRVGQIHADALRVVREQKPDVVLALGDTDTVPAYALAARRNSVAFAHLEAGLRSFNDRSVEELNRRVASAAASLHFAPTLRARTFLQHEGIANERIFVVGNPVTDTLVESSLEPVEVSHRQGVLLTAHRPTNVDDPERLQRLITLVNALSIQVGPVFFPVHPRTARLLAEVSRDTPLSSSVTLSEPLGYVEFIGRLRRSKLVVTDSGGVQEEAAYFGVPVVILRGSTPRWEGVDNGSAVLATLASADGAARALAASLQLTTDESQRKVARLPCPYGDGTTGLQVARVLANASVDELLELREPNFVNGAVPW